MIQIVRFFKCKTCNQINKDYDWNHQNVVALTETTSTIEYECYCPNCKHMNFDEICYGDLPESYKYLMNKQQIRDSLETLRTNCQSEKEFYSIMKQLGWEKINNSGEIS